MQNSCSMFAIAACCRLCCRHNLTFQATASKETLVKICGVTNPRDAEVAVEAGADFIGMIMWQKAKRAVSAATAKQIATIANDAG